MVQPAAQLGQAQLRRDAEAQAVFAVRPQDNVFLGTTAEVELDGVAVGEGVGEERHGGFQTGFWV